MKTIRTSFIKMATVVFVLVLGLSSQSYAVSGSTTAKDKSKQDIDTNTYNVYKGELQDAITKESLVFATIAVEGENTATISNSDGEFILKIQKNSKAKNIIVTHLGYENLVYPISDLKPEKNVLSLQQAVLTLGEVTVYPNSPEYLIRMLLHKVKENYGNKAYNMTGFYREYVKKRSRYISLSEAVVNIYKSSYTGLLNDQVQIYKGRKGSDVRRADTLMFKLQGGPATTMLLDVIKNPTVILDEDLIQYYDFALVNMIKIGSRLNYVVEFTQKENLDYPLYNGKYFVDAENLALTAADFSLNINNPVLATRLFLRKKPIGATVTPTIAKYSAKYRQQDGEWFFNYAKGEVQFIVNWDKKLFNSNFTIMSEIAITDRDEENSERFKYRDQFKRNEILSEQIDAFADEDYWGEYNVIEPDQAIEVAIRRIKRLLGKQEE